MITSLNASSALVETGPCSHLPLHSSAGFDRGEGARLLFPTEDSRRELAFWGGEVQVPFQTKAQFQLTSIRKRSHSV